MSSNNFTKKSPLLDVPKKHSIGINVNDLSRESLPTEPLIKKEDNSGSKSGNNVDPLLLVEEGKGYIQADPDLMNMRSTAKIIVTVIFYLIIVAFLIGFLVISPHERLVNTVVVCIILLFTILLVGFLMVYAEMRKSSRRN
ncbi:hypothetical protein NPIL_217001 [Nephila pilipes]|uniref:Uncharacterized protein n=1 Tax=Nephila pilipes TaxID=299642 RepID=A0A8X6MNY0_NEPPI|nr:hypothetical protein NPIL_217001 [Nephila pilipes]